METQQQQKTSQKASYGTRSSMSDAAISRPSRTIVHAKLEMTQSCDHDEQEADAAANDIVNGGKIRRKISGNGGGGTAVSPQVESQIAQLQGGGHAMPAGLRHMMENGFGRDFSRVRLHTDSQAADMSSSISARAFTHGNDIYFNRGQFSPNTSEGQRLVAHELTHVAQGTGKVGRFTVPIHKEITNKSLNESNIKTSSSFNESLLTGAAEADYVFFSMDYHFDDRVDYAAVQNRIQSLNQEISTEFEGIGCMNKKYGGHDVRFLGIRLHNLQDFYAHSNYAELYIEYYQKANNNQLPTSLPTFDDGFKDTEFNNFLEKRLRTGEFHILDNETIDIIPWEEHANEPTSHNKMNKDKADTFAGELAKQAAIKHTTKILNELGLKFDGDSCYKDKHNTFIDAGKGWNHLFHMDFLNHSNPLDMFGNLMSGGMW